MYCPKCCQEYPGKFCPECGTKLIEKPVPAGGVNLNFGDANAISGGMHLNDSHNIHNEDNSVHNITNTTSTVTNITQVAAQKTEMEILQEKKGIYLNECKRAYEDNVLEQSEVVALEECRIKLGLDKGAADAILESVRMLSERNARKTELNPIARTKLKILTENIQKNDVNALMGQIDSLEVLANRFNHDELARKYYLVLAALKSEKCIAQYENSKTDSYWNSFWSYIAYIKSGRISEAEDTLASLDRFTSYPVDNMTVLGTGGAIMMGDTSTAKELLSAITGEYTPALQHFVDSIYLILDPETAKEMGADESVCAFYLVNFFGKNDSNDKTENGDQKRIDEESMSSQEMYDIGVSFYDGKDGKTQDYVEAVRWFTKAAEQGYGEAQLKLGLCYKSGTGVEKDYVEAVNWLRKAADQGINAAIMYLGSCYVIGQGVSVDLDEAVRWLKKFKYNKDESKVDQLYKILCGVIAERWYNLGREYYYGEDGKQQDDAEAVKWFQKSVGFWPTRECLNFLGFCYSNGKGVDKDAAEALKLFRIAAEPGPNWVNGLSAAQFNMGLQYEYGEGVPKDIDEALRWYKKAAEGGDSDAKEKLKKYGK